MIWQRVFVHSLWLCFVHATIGPHGNVEQPRTSVPTNSPQEHFLMTLFDELWFTSRNRVSHVSKCEALLSSNITRDHVAFRSFGSIHRISRIFEALGYEARGCYNFPQQHLTAFHYEHVHAPRMPKLFISELKVFELEREARDIIDDALRSHRSDLTTEFLVRLRENPTLDLIPSLQTYLDNIPWKAPTKQQVDTLNRFSPYAAWVLVHGYRVNHFAALITPPNTLESIVETLRTAGLPMKATIEGQIGSKLRQTSTQAVMTSVNITGEDGHPTTMNWTYAYMEFAERNSINGNRFDGFLGPQATELFEMTNIEAVVAHEEL